MTCFTRTHIVALCCWIFCLGSSSLQAADIVNLDGKAVTGQLVGLTAENLVFKDATGMEQTIALRSLALVSSGLPVNPLPPLYDEVELMDGTLLKVQNVRIVKTDLRAAVATDPLDGFTDPKLEMPITTVFTWLRNAPTGNYRNELSTILSKRGNRDLFISRIRQENADMLVPTEGTVLGGNDDGTRLTFEDVRGAQNTLPLARFMGLVFNQAPKAVVPPTLCRVTDRYGNMLVATAITTKANGQATEVTVKTVAGLEVVYPSFDVFSKLDFSQGNMKPLTDLQPKVDAPPVAEGDLFMPYLKNKTPNGVIRLKSKVYAKGLWIAPDTALVYPLDGEYREFKAMLGIDEAVQVAQGTIRVTIEADGRKLFEKQFVRKANEYDAINLNVKDVKELKINVEGSGLFTGAALSLGDARLQK